MSGVTTEVAKRGRARTVNMFELEQFNEARFLTRKQVTDTDPEQLFQTPFAIKDFKLMESSDPMNDHYEAEWQEVRQSWQSNQQIRSTHGRANSGFEELRLRRDLMSKLIDLLPRGSTWTMEKRDVSSHERLAKALHPSMWIVQKSDKGSRVETAGLPVVRICVNGTRDIAGEPF